MKNLRLLAVSLLVVTAGCARLVTVPPEQVPSLNDKDWVVSEAPPPPPPPVAPPTPPPVTL